MNILGTQTPNLEHKKIILGIQGAPGHGKTVSALTFPNVVYGDLENRLGSVSDVMKSVHGVDVSKVQQVPFYSREFVVKMLGEKNSILKGIAPYGDVLNVRDAMKKWLSEVGPTIPAGYTYVHDSWTRTQEQFDRATEAVPIYDKKGEIDTYAFWQLKIDYSEKLMGFFDSFECNVVVIFHETQERSPTGVLLDRTQPLMQGKFVAKIKSYFSDFYRAVVITEVGADGKPKMSSETHKPVNNYMWQTGTDKDFAAKCSRVNLPFHIPATYKSLVL